MTPRKLHWILFVVGLAALCLLVAAPVAQASRLFSEPDPYHPGADRIVDPPDGGPTGGGGGEGGDPDDYSNLLRAPQDPALDPGSDSRIVRIGVRDEWIWTEPMLHAVLIWLGFER